MSEPRTQYITDTHHWDSDGEYHHVNNVDIFVYIRNGNPQVLVMRWACSCGESYAKEEYAWDCKKCRRYLVDEDYSRRVVNDLILGMTHYQPSGEEDALDNTLRTAVL